jgi:hypothetical protein
MGEVATGRSTSKSRLMISLIWHNSSYDIDFLGQKTWVVLVISLVFEYPLDAMTNRLQDGNDVLNLKHGGGDVKWIVMVQY